MSQGSKMRFLAEMVKTSACVWIVKHTVFVTPAPMGAVEYKVLRHPFMKELLLNSVTPAAAVVVARLEGHAGPLSAVPSACQLKPLLEPSQTLTHQQSRDDQVSLSPPTPTPSGPSPDHPDPAQLLERFGVLGK